jgi:putative redox protein
MTIEIGFPRGVEVTARFQNFLVATDQSQDHGGQGSAPEPFDLFLAALGTCAGLFALRFCRQRKITTAGLGLRLTTVEDGERHRLASIRLEIALPDGFPERYRDAIVRAVDQCAVKRHLIEPPAFEGTVARPAGCAAPAAATLATPIL